MTQGRMKNGLREEAKVAMWMFYSEHRAWMPAYIRQYREEILDGIQSGQAVEVVFNTIIDRVEPDRVA